MALASGLFPRDCTGACVRFLFLHFFFSFVFTMLCNAKECSLRKRLLVLGKMEI